MFKTLSAEPKSMSRIQLPGRAAVTGLLSVLILSIAANGCGRGRKIPGLDGFQAGVIQKRLYVSFVSTTLEWDVGGQFPIPGLDGATLGIAPDLNSGGTVFQFSVPIESLLNNGKPLPYSALPDGRPIPDITDGQLPRWDFTAKNLTMSFYLSDEAFGAFVPLTLKTRKGKTLSSYISVSIEDERGNLIGKAYAIPPNVSGGGSGVFILLPYLGGQPEGRQGLN